MQKITENSLTFSFAYPYYICYYILAQADYKNNIKRKQPFARGQMVVYFKSQLIYRQRY